MHDFSCSFYVNMFKVMIFKILNIMNPSLFYVYYKLQNIYIQL